MKEESLAHLSLHSRGVYVDATLGLGGHTVAIADYLDAGKVIGIDTDGQALNIAKERLTSVLDKVKLVQGNFVEIDSVVQNLGHRKVNGILADLGVSSMELDNPERGFSFQQDGPLDMRMNPQGQDLTAADIVNTYTEADLAELFRKYGDEIFPGRIARVIVEQRRKQELRTTQDLVELILSVVPRKRIGGIHPATRVFQALRIEVNDELTALEVFIQKSVDLLESGGRLVIISFHSGEDRIVKHIFRRLKQEQKGKIITKKPLLPSEEEKMSNPRSRSAKMRVLEKH